MNPLRITLIYLLLSVLWILFSDRFVSVFNPHDAALWQTLKGLGFVALTAILLYYLISRLVAKLEKLNSELEKRVEEEVAKRREGEQILINQARLNALSETLRLVAHHWRQPLSRVSLGAQDIEDSYLHGEMDPEYMKKSVERMMRELQAMSHTIDQFSHFFGKEGEGQEILVSQSIDRARNIIKELLVYDDIKLTIDNRIEGGEIAARGSPSSFKQAVLTILSNAREAIEHAVKNSFLPPGTGRIDIALQQHEGFVQIDICNNGMPIAQEHLPKIFAPYFTTKFESAGTGLSLYAAKMMIEKQMGGRLTFRNLPRGVCFTIRLPID